MRYCESSDTIKKRSVHEFLQEYKNEMCSRFLHGKKGVHDVYDGRKKIL